MSTPFDASNAPFDRLDAAEVALIQDAVDIGYYRPGETLVAAGSAPEHLFVVIKGTVEENEGGELLALLGPNDSFDGPAVVQGTARRHFTARDEVLAYLIPRAVVLDLVRRNDRFASFFYLEISRKLDALAAEDEDQRVGALMRARLSDVFVHRAAFIGATDTIETAGRAMEAANVNAVFVRDGDRTGLITGMNLAKAMILKRLPLDTPVRDLAHYDVVSLAPDAFVFQALLLMSKHNKRRIAVREGDVFVGLVEDLDLLGFVAGNAQLVAGRIERATNTDELGAAAAGIDDQIRLLRRQGVKVEVVAEIASDLSRRLQGRLYEMLAPEAWRRSACLVVMGSEGRGEQTWRTDQDNGLILPGRVDDEELGRFRTAYCDALERFGFPPCPGGVMVRNPAWSKPVDEWTADIARWVTLPDESAHMNVAIVYDAECVAGDPALLARVKGELIARVRGETAYLAHFARAIDAFASPIGLFNTFVTGEGDMLDLKKGGIFPVVHGARALALEKGLEETSTVQRIQRLGETNVLRADFARELAQAFRFLLQLRLDAQLAHTGGESGALLKPAALSSMERDLLRDAFVLVKQFREIVRRHFNLGLF
jgi:CBS domain-containing protein